ncbi:MAG: asparagine synthase (glutamine-hydrolyzing) [Magnetococcales bacterium]|nr:asparagine synthase (glutamine-hydrolyzing) [Magnetococcales bacterium]
MCGILGWFSPKGVPPEPDLYLQGLRVLRHRGPDDEGTLVRDGLWFGHTRLAIMDVAHGRQPWVDEGTGVAIIYNGELYNFIEERSILEGKGYHFRTHCDTEVLLTMYLAYGEAMLGRINGMFAFAIHDPRDNSLFCARDHAGIKPIYYMERDDGILFASEIKAMVAIHGTMEPNPTAMADYVSLQYVLGSKTFFKNVYRLEPGECLRIQADGTRVKRHYWSLSPEETFCGSFEEAAEQLHALMDDAIRLQLRSDVPLGAHLSGGLDTGVICTLAARRIAPNKLSTFTAGFREGGVFDDTAAAQVSSKFAETRHHEIFPSASDFLELFPTLLYHLDEPMAGQGVFPQYMVSRLAQTKVRVVLGGQGADELFGGYTRYYLLLLDQTLRNGADRGQERIGLTWDALGKGLGQLHNYGPLWSQMQAGTAFQSPVNRYWMMIDRSGDMKNTLTESFMESLAGYQPFDTFSSLFGRYSNAELLNRILHFETTCWLPALLHIEDRMSMAVSLESRVPFLDPGIMRFAFGLPTRIKLHDGKTKAVMRQAFQGELAQPIRDRRDKLGFPTPTSQWFSGPLRDFVWETLNSVESRQRGIFTSEALRQATEQQQGDFDRSLWGMLNLELWHRNLKPAPMTLG